MRTSLSLTLDTRRERKDSSFPIIMRVGHFQRTNHFNYSVDGTNISINP